MARFAVLSACETTRVEDSLSDELVNFPTALLQCGLSGVVGTLWTSHDRASSVLMDAFYQEWQGSRVPPAEALRRAQQRIRASRVRLPALLGQLRLRRPLTALSRWPRAPGRPADAVHAM